MTNAAKPRPAAIMAEDSWSPELVEVIKRAAVEAHLGAGSLSVHFLGDGRFSAGPVLGARRIVVGVERDEAGAPTLQFWREANPQLFAWHREMLRSRGLDLDSYRFPAENVARHIFIVLCPGELCARRGGSSRGAGRQSRSQ